MDLLLPAVRLLPRTGAGPDAKERERERERCLFWSRRRGGGEFEGLRLRLWCIGPLER